MSNGTQTHPSIYPFGGCDSVIDRYIIQYVLAVSKSPSHRSRLGRPGGDSSPLTLAPPPRAPPPPHRRRRKLPGKARAADGGGRAFLAASPGPGGRFGRGLIWRRHTRGPPDVWHRDLASGDGCIRRQPCRRRRRMLGQAGGVTLGPLHLASPWCRLRPGEDRLLGCGGA